MTEKLKFRLLVACFAFGLFGSAALMFNIQPMLGKMLLPKVGGAPAVWNVAMAYFQTVLLIGYLLAHLLSRLSVRLHGLIYILILLGAVASLPIALPEGWEMAAGASPYWPIISVLALTTGLPFLALSLGAPTLQRLFAATPHPDAKDPYFLYAASNLGSFVGLFAYPLWFEPRYALTEQAVVWEAIYFSFVALAIVCLFLTLRLARSQTVAAVAVGEKESVAPSWPQRLQWLALAAIPSGLSLATTTHITTDVASMPLLWAVILGLYLLTFVLAFHPPKWLKTDYVMAAHVPLVIIALLPTSAEMRQGYFSMIPYLLAFFTATLACHMRLVAVRPAARHLTGFYLWMSLGGAVGGMVMALAVPSLLIRSGEFHVLLVLSLVANILPFVAHNRAHVLVILGVAAVLALASTSLMAGIPALWLLAAAVLILSPFALRYKTYLPAIAGVLAFSSFYTGHGTGVIFADRNFFGIVRVDDVEKKHNNEVVTVRNFVHGTTLHGAQIIKPEVVNLPNGYYSPYSPAAIVFNDERLKGVAVMGLGAGNMNCFTAPGRRYHFFEIDPLVVKVAQEYFSFLSDCPAPTITVGDGRLMLLSEPGGPYDLIVADAFTSDAIPVHLVTVEALRAYLSQLTPNGVILFNVSNRYFNLTPMLARNAAEVGIAVIAGQTIPPKDAPVISYASQWVAMARTPELLAPYLGQNGWKVVEADLRLRPWTDGYSNLLSVLK